MKIPFHSLVCKWSADFCDLYDKELVAKAFRICGFGSTEPESYHQKLKDVLAGIDVEVDERGKYVDDGLVFTLPESEKIYLTFELFGSQFDTKDKQSPKSFAIAGEDGNFVWAEARIEGDKIVVWNNSVPEPKAVRYAWENNPH